MDMARTGTARMTLIHGLGGAPSELEPFRKAFAAEHHAWCPALLSHGGRPLAPVGGFDPMIADLVRQLDSRRSHWGVLFGYSLGGYLALHLAQRFPRRVDGVVMLASPVFYRDEIMRFIRYLVSPERVYGGSEEKRAAIVSHYGGEGIFEKRVARALDLFQRLHNNPPLREDNLGEIRTPVLLVSGETDQFAPRHVVEEIAGLLPDAQVALYPGRMHPLDDAPIEAIVERVRRFMAGLADPIAGRAAQAAVPAQTV
jgi:pimeloyl-ACP methyl ester carboxylesterase